MNKQLSEALAKHRERHTSFLHKVLNNQPRVSEQLFGAMEYAVLLGGKRVRPFLVYASGELLGAAADDLDAPAAAVECIHAYSLVHDDLPSMDDDNLRRGQPTCHIAFDEATAILAGDALQALAFEILASHRYAHVTTGQQIEMIRLLAEASGQAGMCGGQALDLAATHTPVNAAALEKIHHYKTGALIEGAVRLAITCAPDISPDTEKGMRNWARIIGLAFQVRDDILDEVGNTATLGKEQGSDREQQKSTYPSLLGLQNAEDLLQDLHEKALQALTGIPYNTSLLEAFTDYLITRDR